MAVDKLIDSTQLNADLTSIANAIRAKGKTSASLAFPADFVDAIMDIETGGDTGGDADPLKAVKFIDYDGKLLYSYTASELQALTELPANPNHSGLTAQGWNWSLEQAKAQLTAMPDSKLTVGQMYITDDGKTRIYCHFETGRLSPYFGIGVKGTVTVDWGDGSDADTLTGTSLTTAKTVQHTYSAAGDYTITLTVVSGSFAFFGVSNAAHILKKNTTTTASISRVYANAVQRVEIGANASIDMYAFNSCYSLASITIPESITSIGNYAFYHCYSLTSITIPKNVTSIGNDAFNDCYNLTSITIPKSVTSISSNSFTSCYNLASITIPYSVTNIISGAFYYCSSLPSITIPENITSISSSMFYNCYSLASLTIPKNVTSIGSSAFYNCYGLGEIHFMPTTPPTVSNTNAFNSVQTDCKIYVPVGSLAAYTSATNYPNNSRYTYIEE